MLLDFLVPMFVGAVIGGSAIAFYMAIKHDGVSHKLKRAREKLSRLDPEECECEHCGETLVKGLTRVPRRGPNRYPDRVWLHEESMRKKCSLEGECKDD